MCIIFKSESKFHCFGLHSIAYLSFKNMKWILTQTFFLCFDTQTFFCVHPSCRFYNFFASFLHSTRKIEMIFYIDKTLQNSTSTMQNGKIYNWKILLLFLFFQYVQLHFVIFFFVYAYYINLRGHAFIMQELKIKCFYLSPFLELCPPHTLFCFIMCV